MTVNKRSGDTPEPKPTPRKRLMTCVTLPWKYLAIFAQLRRFVVELRLPPTTSHSHSQKIESCIETEVKTPIPTRCASVLTSDDRGTSGKLDTKLDKQNGHTIPGLHCHHSFTSNGRFGGTMDQGLGKFFSTAHMLRHFDRIVMTVLALCNHPQLRVIYFAYCKRLL